MKKIIAKDDFWELFPQCKLGLVVCKEMDNHYHQNESEYEELLRNGEQKGLTFVQAEPIAENKVIKVWREAFTKFKTKKGVRCSIENLLKRITKDNPVGTINPLVDLYNAVSLSYAMPLGGEDLDCVEGNILLTKADGNELFRTIGSDVNEPPYPEELVYKDDAGVLCRCWTWKEAERTMLTEKTKNAMLCCELIDPDREEEFMEALETLKQLITEKLGGQCEIKILDQHNREAELI
ncbi:DNA/RNA-binding domain of Phe-tRNA-synthetase-like protein [Clostridiales Family XIII bacterium PM5-7]